MAIWFPEHRLLFVLSPRTASTATASTLADELGGAVKVPPEDLLQENGRRLVDAKHATFQQIKKFDLIASKDYENSLKVTTVRNPFDSVYSLWYKMTHQYWELRNDPSAFFQRIPGYVENMKRMRNESFSEWFLRTYGSVNSDNVIAEKKINTKWADGADRLLKFETLSEDFDRLLDTIGVEKKFAIRLLNVTKGRKRDYREVYTDEARELGEQVFASELRKFRYKF